MKKPSLNEFIFYYLIPLIFIGSYLFTAVKEVRYGLNRDYAEGTTLAFVDKYRSATSPRDIYSAESFQEGEIIGYPALHLALISALSSDASTALSSGRIVSVTSILLISVLAWLILFKGQLVNLKFLPLITTLLLYQSAIYDWSLLARADLLAALFEVLGIFIFLRSNGKSIGSLAISMICFAGAFLCKQNAVAGPILIVILLALNNRRTFLKSLPVLAVVSISIGLIVTALFGGSYWQHTILQLGKQEFFLSRLLQLISGYLPAHLFLFALALIAMKFSDHKLAKRVLPVWIGIALILALTGLGRSGSNYNYFISLSVPLGIIAFLGIRVVMQMEMSSKKLMALICLALFTGMAFAENSNLAGRLTFLDHRSWPPSRQEPEIALSKTRTHLESIGAKNVFCDEPGICALLGYPTKYMYFENQMHSVRKTDLTQVFDTLLLTEYPDKNLAWTQFKLPAGFLDQIQADYELQRITEMGFVFARKQ
ncbi:hypothetical protein [Bdellovibrio sp. GT3]|uniref:hypothetical protein n=1 Tax=Bdellovibrio sp. GT3 TaxID=3136282 RepID=UPI0030F1F20E